MQGAGFKVVRTYGRKQNTRLIQNANNNVFFNPGQTRKPLTLDSDSDSDNDNDDNDNDGTSDGQGDGDGRSTGTQEHSSELSACRSDDPRDSDYKDEDGPRSKPETLPARARQPPRAGRRPPPASMRPTPSQPAPASAQPLPAPPQLDPPGDVEIPAPSAKPAKRGRKPRAAPARKPKPSSKQTSTDLLASPASAPLAPSKTRTSPSALGSLSKTRQPRIRKPKTPAGSAVSQSLHSQGVSRSTPIASTHRVFKSLAEQLGSPIVILPGSPTHPSRTDRAPTNHGMSGGSSLIQEHDPVNETNASPNSETTAGEGGFSIAQPDEPGTPPDRISRLLGGMGVVRLAKTTERAAPIAHSSDSCHSPLARAALRASARRYNLSNKRSQEHPTAVPNPTDAISPPRFDFSFLSPGGIAAFAELSRRLSHISRISGDLGDLGDMDSFEIEPDDDADSVTESPTGIQILTPIRGRSDPSSPSSDETVAVSDANLEISDVDESQPEPGEAEVDTVPIEPGRPKPESIPTSDCEPERLARASALTKLAVQRRKSRRTTLQLDSLEHHSGSGSNGDSDDDDDSIGDSTHESLGNDGDSKDHDTRGDSNDDTRDSSDSTNLDSMISHMSLQAAMLPPATPKAKRRQVGLRDLLQLCSQTEPTTFSGQYTTKSLFKWKKLAEATFAEVYIFTEPGEKSRSIVKVVPFGKPEILVNETPQMSVQQIYQEAVITQTMGNLDGASNFVRMKRCNVCRGPYPKELLKAWDRYDKQKESENDRPDYFESDQLFVIWILEDAGTSLEDYPLQTWKQAISIILQVVASLAIAERTVRFEHRDLHWSNVMVSETDAGTIQYSGLEATTELTVPTRGLKIHIIDYTLSRIEIDNELFFVELEDEDFFTGTGDYQFEIYRMMRELTQGNWARRTPKTNVMWIHYLFEKLQGSKKLPRIKGRWGKDIEGQKELRAFGARIMGYATATEMLQDPLFDQIHELP
ncbi:uncharacterized protein BJ171DRAFT_515961 [Polychytrium aggregatum]|uniref:uncharacterized protein n=1 Tax=Polychytrium aggregatum TaxID=110093 RepID=UPI0022FE8FD1|nr:uncharacterized protein BJ171DRAFT_515961 [Polychytrium aggregatum]KAI9201927.1 hypothetical protein BJ171DRAFT_515961 [Polychytrium aggregatum]